MDLIKYINNKIFNLCNKFYIYKSYIYIKHYIMFNYL